MTSNVNNNGIIATFVLTCKVDSSAIGCPDKWRRRQGWLPPDTTASVPPYCCDFSNYIPRDPLCNQLWAYNKARTWFRAATRCSWTLSWCGRIRWWPSSQRQRPSSWSSSCKRTASDLWTPPPRPSTLCSS